MTMLSGSSTTADATPCLTKGITATKYSSSTLRKQKPMKNPDRKTISKLDDLPNIGPALADALRLIGITRPQQLIGQDPFELYRTLCTKTDKPCDPCAIDVFMSAVHFMEGGNPRPWWSFTAQRKKHTTNDHTSPPKKRRRSVF